MDTSHLLLPKKSLDRFGNQDAFSINLCKVVENNFEIVHFSVKFQVTGGRGEIMAGRGWRWQNYGFSLVVVDGGVKIMTGRGWWQQSYGWSWVVVDGRGWSHDSYPWRTQ